VKRTNYEKLHRRRRYESPSGDSICHLSNNPSPQREKANPLLDLTRLETLLPPIRKRGKKKTKKSNASLVANRESRTLSRMERASGGQGGTKGYSTDQGMGDVKNGAIQKDYGLRPAKINGKVLSPGRSTTQEQTVPSRSKGKTRGEERRRKKQRGA